MSQFDPGSLPPTMPVPVRALPYSVPAYYGRPGIITAIGVLCIVVACLSGFGSMISGMYGFGFWMMSRVTSTMSTAPIATSTTVSTGSGATTSQSLPPADASVAVNELTKTLSLDGPHVRELDKLMRLHGREILGGDEDTPVAAGTVRAALTGHGADPSNGVVYFTTAEGRVDIFRDRTSFVAADGSITINTSARKNSDSLQQTMSNAPVAGTPGTTLTPAQVDQLVASVQGMSTAPLNAQQLASLKAELSKPNQQLATPGPSPAASFVNARGRSNVSIGFDTGNVLVLGPQGQVISSGAFVPRIAITGTSAAMVIGEGAASVALAIYLLVVGILVFRSYPKSPRLLRIYAILKIPLALLAGAGMGLMGYQFATSILSSGGTPSGAPPIMGFIIWAAVITVLGCAFPLGLLIALRTRTVRDYFNSVAA